MAASAASCVCAFSITNASATPAAAAAAAASSRVDGIGMKRVRCPGVITSLITYSCPSHSAVSCSFSTLQLLSPPRTWRLPRFSALATGSSEVDQDEEEAALSPQPSDEEAFDPIQFPAATKLYVGNLPWTCDSQQVAELFQECGSVELVEVIYDRETGRSRGFAFVTMTTPDDASRAIERFDQSVFGGRTLRVNFPDRSRSVGVRSDRSMRRDGGMYDSVNKVFVGNLAWGVDDATLEQVFSEHGKVLEARVVYDRDTGRSRGFGFVTFSSEEEVKHAISSLDGADIEGRSLRVNLAADKPPIRRDF
eukprot:c23413_g1_i1 orf=248-1171(+)